MSQLAGKVAIVTGAARGLGRAYAEAMALNALDPKAISGERLDQALYHFYPPLEQVRAWLDQAGLAIEEEGIEGWYTHLLARKSA